jgi:hypothetical protein
MQVRRGQPSCPFLLLRAQEHVNAPPGANLLAWPRPHRRTTARRAPCRSSSAHDRAAKTCVRPARSIPRCFAWIRHSRVRSASALAVAPPRHSCSKIQGGRFSTANTPLQPVHASCSEERCRPVRHHPARPQRGPDLTVSGRGRLFSKLTKLLPRLTHITEPRRPTCKVRTSRTTQPPLPPPRPALNQGTQPGRGSFFRYSVNARNRRRVDLCGRTPALRSASYGGLGANPVPPLETPRPVPGAP